MLETKIDEAINCLHNASPGLYVGFLSFLRGDDIKSQSCAYESHGAIIIKTVWWDHKTIMWYVCDTGKGDLASARNELIEKTGDYKERGMYCIGDLEGDHVLVFSRMGGGQYDNTGIRPLSENDGEQIILATTVPDDDSEFAKAIAGVIKDNYLEIINNPEKHILGIFDGETLAGIITFDNCNNKELINISDVFVPHEYRGRGYASKLIRAATAVYPDVRYWYTCGTPNVASIASAKSAGYVFEGTCTYEL